MRRWRVLTVATTVGTVFLFAAACVAGPNELTGATGAAGFWSGLWQGLISPVTFLISLFDAEVNIYEVHYNGNWYDFGFMLGVAIIFSGPAKLGGSRTAQRLTKKSKSE